MMDWAKRRMTKIVVSHVLKESGMKITIGHISAVGALLVGGGMMVGGYHDWSEALTPMNVSGALIMVGGFLKALSGEPVQGRRIYTPEERAAAKPTPSTGIFKLWAIVALLFLPASAWAQTTNTFAWEYTVAPGEVATYTQIAAVDGTPVTGVPTCGPKAGNAAHTACSVPIPALSSGSHTLSVAAARGGMVAETRVTGVDPNNAPVNATAPRVVITVTVTIP